MSCPQDNSGEANIAKRAKNDKTPPAWVCTLGVGWRFIATFMGIMSAQHAVAVPVVIAWQVPLARTETYVLEVARDPGFAEIVLNEEVRGSGLTWNTPGEGVFHWRLARPSQKGSGKEGSTFVSGSFAAIDSSGGRERPARLSWAAVAGADRYKLYMVTADGKSRTMMTASPNFIVPKDSRSLTVEVVPYSGGARTFRDYHYNPSLVLDSGREQAKAAQTLSSVASSLPPVVAQGVREPAASQTVDSSVGAVTAQAGTEDVPMPKTAEAATPEAGQRRLHVIQVYAKQAFETIELQKLAIDWDSEEFVTGWGAEFWSNPFSGVILTGSGDYHEHQAVIMQETLFPNQKIIFDEARYFAQIGLGFDFLRLFDARHQMLALTAHTALTQAPSLALVMDPQTLIFPADPSQKVESRQMSFFGGGLAYGFLSPSLGIILSGQHMIDENDNTLSMGRLSFDLYPSPSLAVQLALYGRALSYRRCHETTASCLAQGASQTTVLEAGATLGLGLVFF